MTAVELLKLAVTVKSIFATAQEMSEYLYRQAAILERDGKLSEEQREMIRDAAGESRRDWDEAVAEARARLAEEG